MNKILALKDLYIRIESLSINVTGTCNYLTFHLPDGTEESILIDCGLFIDREELEYNRGFPFDCKKILAALVTHAHADHYARLPCLYNFGFTGKVYSSEYTVEKIKTHAMKNYYSMKRSFNPMLYQEKDVTELIKNSYSMELYTVYKLNENIEVMLLENAHTKGAVMYLITFKYQDRAIRLLFTGDYKYKSFFGKSYFPLEDQKYNYPITIVTEATHGSKQQPKEVLKKEVEKAICENKSIIIIANGDSRFEVICDEIKQMQSQGKISSSLPIYLEFKRNFNLATLDLDILPNNITFVKDSNSRKNALYERRQKIVIITNRGTTEFFLKNTIEKDRYAIFYTNYVSKGTVADRVINTPKGKEVIIANEKHKKMADVKNTEEYSGHDFLEGVIKLFRGFSNINAILLEHGEELEKESLREKIMKAFPKSKTYILKRGKAFKITESGVKYSK